MQTPLQKWWHSPLKNERGMALLLVISLVAILMIITLQFGQEIRQSYIVSAGLKTGIQLSEICRSGIMIGRELLLQDSEENTFDSFYDSWALLAEEDLSEIFERGELTVTVSDESGKFQINAMILEEEKDGAKEVGKEVTKETEKKTDTDSEAETAADKHKQKEVDFRNILWRLLRAEPFLVEDGDARQIIDSLIDWIDTGDGDSEEEYGAEDGYYKGLEPPYSCKNGPVESIDELLLVRGFTKELLYGTDDIPPLAPLLAIWGNDAKINLNTAPLLILQAMAEDIDKEMAKDMVGFREEEKNKDTLATPQWYKDVTSFPGNVEIREDFITTQSHFFTIEAVAKSDMYTKTVTAGIERNEDGTSIIQWHKE